MSSTDELMPGLKVDNILTDTKYKMDSIIKLMNLCLRKFADIHKIKCHTQADTEPYFYMFCSFLQVPQNLLKKDVVEKKLNQPTNQKKSNQKSN